MKKIVNADSYQIVVVWCEEDDSIFMHLLASDKWPTNITVVRLLEFPKRELSQIEEAPLR